MKTELRKSGKSKVENLVKTSRASIEKHTGKDWDWWLRAIKKDGGESLSRKDIVQLLSKKYKLKKPWWQQIIATGFEVHSGRRQEGQNFKGEYQVTVTKSINIGQKAFWNFFISDRGLQLWLKPMSRFRLQKGEFFEVAGGVHGEVRTLSAPEKVRLTWIDSDWPKKTVLQIYIGARSKDRCILAFIHEQLASARIKERMRQYWKERVSQMLTELSQ